MWQCVYVAILLLVTLAVYLSNFAKDHNLITSNTSIQLNVYGKAKNASENFRKAPGIARKNIKHHVPKFMLDLYEENRGGSGTRADLVKSLIPKTAGSLRDGNLVDDSGENHLLVFDLPALKEDEEFLSAELKILTVVEVNPETVAGIERTITISTYDEASGELVLLDELHVYHNDNTWLTFNVTRPVVDRLIDGRGHGKRLEIVVSIRNFLPYFQPRQPGGDFRLSLMPIVEDFEHDYPVLLLNYASHGKDNGGRRLKRNVEEDYEEETNHLWDDEVGKKLSRKLKRARNTCRRKPLYVDFAEIQYDAWIVQPSGYEAYQCTGKCFYPVADHLSPTKHAIVQALLHSVSPSRAPRSCCVPTKLDSISVLYIDEVGVLTYRYAYNDMVVVECGCR